MGDLFWRGVELTGLGMGVVFGFLLLQIGLLLLVSAVVRRLVPEENLGSAENGVEPSREQSTQDETLVAAVVAAVAAYRARHR